MTWAAAISRPARWRRSRALDEQRRELLAGVGHELKTPLSIVLGLCGRLLAAADLGDGHTEDVQRIRANAYVLLKRVEELLQVSRLDGGHLELEPRDVDVARLVRSSFEASPASPSCASSALCSRRRRGCRRAWTRRRCPSVVSNLLANALKYAPVRRHGALRPRERGRATAHRGRRQRPQHVDDGLRKQMLKHYRRGAGSAARPGGTELGLAIVRDLVALHNGIVTLTDAPEGGALFVVDLPLNVDGGAGQAHTAGALPTIDVAERQRARVERLRAELDADGRRDAAAVAGEPGADRARILIVTGDSELGAFVAGAHRPPLRRRPRDRRAGGGTR